MSTSRIPCIPFLFLSGVLRRHGAHRPVLKAAMPAESELPGPSRCPRNVLNYTRNPRSPTACMLWTDVRTHLHWCRGLMSGHTCIGAVAWHQGTPALVPWLGIRVHWCCGLASGHIRIGAVAWHQGIPALVLWLTSGHTRIGAVHPQQPAVTPAHRH